MNVSNIYEAKSWFEVLHTTERSQAAVMTLSPGGTSSEELNLHKKSDQILLVTDGEVQAEIGTESRPPKAGDMCLIPAGTKHRIVNNGTKPATTFNVYSPPEYAANEKG